jgi:hypothetical protein
MAQTKPDTIFHFFLKIHFLTEMRTHFSAPSNMLAGARMFGFPKIRSEGIVHGISCGHDVAMATEPPRFEECNSIRALKMRCNRIRHYLSGAAQSRRRPLLSQGYPVGGVAPQQQVRAAQARRQSALEGNLLAETLCVWPFRAAEHVCLWPFLAAWLLFYRWSPDPP